MKNVLVREETRPWRIWFCLECGVNRRTILWYVRKYGLKFRKFKGGGGFAVGPFMFCWGKETMYIYELQGEEEDDV